jgi:hypothetical protein
MQHSFDVDIAKEYGILEAILLNNLGFWIEKNRANNVNYYDGYYWTFNSVKAFNQLFPYVSQRQIQTALKHLKEEGLIQTGNYNKLAYDRTLWYAFTEKGKCIMQKCKMEDTKMLNGLYENVEPIPDINTDINTNINKDINTDNNIIISKENDCVTPKQLEEEFDLIWQDYPKKQGKANALKSYIKARKKGTTKEEVINGLNNYLTYIKFEKVTPQYIKHGSTWFNQQCWNDDYTIKREVTTGDLANAGLVDFSKFR